MIAHFTPVAIPVTPWTGQRQSHARHVKENGRIKRKRARKKGSLKEPFLLLLGAGWQDTRD